MRRWAMWGILLASMWVVMFHRVAPAVIVDQVMAEFSLSAVTFSSLAALYFYTYAIMQIPTGVLTDVLGVRRTVTFGLLTASAGSIILGIAPDVSIVYLGRFLVSLGVAVIWVSILRFLYEWFSPREFGTLSGLSAALSSVGAIFAATPLAILVRNTEWRFPFILVGLVTFGLALACWLLVRDHPSGTNSPRLFKHLQTKNIMTKLRMVVTNKYTWPAVLVAMAYGPFITFTGTWGISYLIQVYGLSCEAAANYALLGAIGMMLGCSVQGFISDRMGRRKLPILIFTAANLFIWAVLTVWDSGKPPLLILYPICFFMGFCGNVHVLSHACIKEVNSRNVAGMAMGLTNASSFFASAMLQLLFGYVLDSGWQGVIVRGARFYPLGAYQAGFILCFVTALVGTAGAFLLKETHCQNIYQE